MRKTPTYEKVGVFVSIIGLGVWRDTRQKRPYEASARERRTITTLRRGAPYEAFWGYQPLQKWLKDRKGRKLSDADVSHYKRIVRALRRTAALMAEIDKLPVTASSTVHATN